jgi:hypothetical protein
METTTKVSAGLSTKAVVAVAAVVVAAVVAVAAVVVIQSRKSDTGIGYAAEATVMLDQNSLQEAMDKAMENAREGNVALQYKDNAYSTDGSNFDCYIVNSANNLYDMFITIYADLDMTDELYLSQLVPPGSGFEHLTLEHPLDVGDHTVYVALTQVETDEETGEQSVHKQVVYTMDFHVEK